jgi:hypothetical protein
MTQFSYNQKRKADSIFKLLRSQTSEFLIERHITQCETCDGTGVPACKLPGRSEYCWPDTDEYCDKCYGLGYLGYDKIIDFNGTKYMCSKCQSIGCDECDHTGFVDWISHIMGKGK